MENLLRGLDLYEFYAEMNRPADALYHNKALSAELVDSLLFILGSGTYGPM